MSMSAHSFPSVPAEQDFMLWVTGLGNGEFWFLTSAAALVASVSFYSAFKNLKFARLLEDTPTASVHGAAQGYLELIGTSETMEGPRITGPLTGVPCVWWTYRIEEEQKGAKGERHWRTTEKGTSDELFLLRDATGACIIDPEGAEVLANESNTWRASKITRARADNPGPRRSPFGRYRMTERRISLNSPLHAIGWFETRHAGDHGLGFNEEVRELLSSWKRNRRTLLAQFDTNRDGEIDFKEWEVARKEARHIIREQRAERAIAPGIDILCKPADERPFLIAAVPQPVVARRKRRAARLGVAAFFVFGAFAVFMLSVRFTGSY